MADLIHTISQWNDTWDGVILNVGKVEGGGSSMLCRIWPSVA